jgi:hypothetical protein
VDYPLGQVVFEIKHGPLLMLLEVELEHYPGLVFDEGLFAIHEPFAPLLHHWDRLETKSRLGDDSEITSEVSDATSILALAALLKCVKDVPSLKRYFASRDSRETTGSTTFEFLWTFFPPGDLAIAVVSGND